MINLFKKKESLKGKIRIILKYILVRTYNYELEILYTYMYSVHCTGSTL